MTPEGIDAASTLSAHVAAEATHVAAHEATHEVTPPRIRRKRRWVMQYLPDEVNCVLRDYDAGMNAKEISERHGVSKATLYRWIAQFEAQRTVDDDPGSMRMRIAVLEKTVLHLSTANAELRAAAMGEVTHAAS